MVLFAMIVLDPNPVVSFLKSFDDDNFEPIFSLKVGKGASAVNCEFGSISVI